jgi:hypothetical protein
MASVLKERVPFAIAIADPKLLKPRWNTLSTAQKTVLKAFYGLALTEEELVLWSIFQGGATYDDLGYVLKVVEVPYTPKEYDFLTLYVGRRSGKTDKIISTGVAYEITLGGHRQYVPEGQVMKVPFIAQTAGDAQANMNFIRLALEDSPLLAKQLAPDQVASEIRLGAKDKPYLLVEPLPANKSVGRGHGIPVFVGDETAFWYTDPKAANPDYEVLRAIQYSQAQFPFAKTFFGTTPWAERGIAYNNYKAGTEGRKLKCEACTENKAPFCPHPLDDREEFDGILVIHASTAMMGNPLITRKRLMQIRRRDPEAFSRESLAQTLKSVSAWLSHEQIDRAVDTGVEARSPVTDKTVEPGTPIPTYVAAIDPAFRKDSFAFTIVHHDPKKGMVQDYIQYWTPSEAERLKPGEILDDIKSTLTRYGLDSVYSDQYQLESLQQLAMDRQFIINGYDFTGKSKAVITGSFKVLLNENRVRLLDEETQTEQLKLLQREVLQGGNVRIAAPPGKHDDLAMVLMLATRVALYLLTEEPAPVEKPKTVEHDHRKMILEQIERRKREAQYEDDLAA